MLKKHHLLMSSVMLLSAVHAGEEVDGLYPSARASALIGEAAVMSSQHPDSKSVANFSILLQNVADWESTLNGHHAGNMSFKQDQADMLSESLRNIFINTPYAARGEEISALFDQASQAHSQLEAEQVDFDENNFGYQIAISLAEQGFAALKAQYPIVEEEVVEDNGGDAPVEEIVEDNGEEVVV